MIQLISYIDDWRWCKAFVSAAMTWENSLKYFNPWKRGWKFAKLLRGIRASRRGCSDHRSGHLRFRSSFPLVWCHGVGHLGSGAVAFSTVDHVICVCIRKIVVTFRAEKCKGLNSWAKMNCGNLTVASSIIVMGSKSSSIPSDVIGRTPTRRPETLETPRAWASTTRSSATRRGKGSNQFRLPCVAAPKKCSRSSLGPWSVHTDSSICEKSKKKAKRPIRSVGKQ